MVGDVASPYGPLPRQPAGWESGWLVPPETRPVSPGSGLTIKFGGSLLMRRDWPELLEGLVRVVDGPFCLVVGGGPVVEGLRTLDAVCPQPELQMHRLAIRGMGITARLVAGTLGLPLLPHPLAAGAGSGLVDADAWLANGLLADLPASWSVTSDSIAASVAATHGHSLVLAKSSPPPHWSQQQTAGGVLGHLRDWVDPHFAHVAVRLSSVGWAAPRASALT